MLKICCLYPQFSEPENQLKQLLLKTGTYLLKSVTTLQWEGTMTVNSKYSKKNITQQHSYCIYWEKKNRTPSKHSDWGRNATQHWQKKKQKRYNDKNSLADKNQDKGYIQEDIKEQKQKGAQQSTKYQLVRLLMPKNQIVLLDVCTQQVKEYGMTPQQKQKLKIVSTLVYASGNC